MRKQGSERYDRPGVVALQKPGAVITGGLPVAKSTTYIEAIGARHGNECCLGVPFSL